MCNIQNYKITNGIISCLLKGDEHPDIDLETVLANVQERLNKQFSCPSTVSPSQSHGSTTTVTTGEGTVTFL